MRRSSNCTEPSLSISVPWRGAARSCGLAKKIPPKTHFVRRKLRFLNVKMRLRFQELACSRLNTSFSLSGLLPIQDYDVSISGTVFTTHYLPHNLQMGQ
jgi:hypothetical protein